MPLLTDREVAEQHLAAGLDSVYSCIISNAKRQLARVFELAATAPGPVLLHCAAGKDRTGIVSAMLLRAAGVVTVDIVADYVKTEQHMESVLARYRRSDPSFAEGADAYNNDLVRAAPETISRVLDMWDAHPGGVRGWVHDCGVEPDVIALWQQRLVGPAADA